eukprot:1770256-Karenia_brevis.AAC.1
MPDISRVPVRQTAENSYQLLGDITNSNRSVPVSADPSAVGSRASSIHSHRGLGAVQGEQWGDKRKRQDEAAAPRDPREGYVTTWQLSEALAEFQSTVSQGMDKQLQSATGELLQKVAAVVDAQVGAVQNEVRHLADTTDKRFAELEQRFERKLVEIEKRMAEAERSKEEAERRIKDMADTLAKDDEQTCVDVDFDA